MKTENEEIYNVHWEGPFEWSEQKTGILKQNHVLYSFFGTHPIYGPNVLLYIGRTQGGVIKCLGHHNWPIKDDCDEIKIRVASVGKFRNWETWKGRDPYPKATLKLVKKIEALLAYSNRPAQSSYNSQQLQAAEGLRLFNTGKFGQLLPEVSHKYQWGE